MNKGFCNYMILFDHDNFLSLKKKTLLTNIAIPKATKSDRCI